MKKVTSYLILLLPVSYTIYASANKELGDPITMVTAWIRSQTFEENKIKAKLKFFYFFLTKPVLPHITKINKITYLTSIPFFFRSAQLSMGFTKLQKINYIITIDING